MEHYSSTPHITSISSIENFVGTRCAITGWIRERRSHGGLIFIDVFDGYGIFQAVVKKVSVDSTTFELAENLPKESCIEMSGIIRHRDLVEQTISRPSDAYEMAVDSIIVFARSAPTPFVMDEQKTGPVSEDLRLRNRALDIRRGRVLNNLYFRSDAMFAVLDYLRSEGFTYVETPTLSKPTPEGAKDFIVPSINDRVKFFALPQSPQLYKELLVMAGIRRYVQFARCYRGEDSRSDRQPEFTQIDLELSFSNRKEIQRIVNNILDVIFKLKGATPSFHGEISYADAVRRYGRDAPDVRFGLFLSDFDSIKSLIAQSTDHRAQIRGLHVPMSIVGSTHTYLENISQLMKENQQSFRYLFINGESNDVELQTHQDAIIQAIESNTDEVKKVCPGDLVIILEGRETKINVALSQLRAQIGREMKLYSEDEYALIWVVDWPLFMEENDVLTYAHHPFTDSTSDDLSPDSRSLGYDIVMNGTELGGGSVRISSIEKQIKVFETLGISEELVKDKFGFLLRGMQYGCPPMCGIALGFDRLISILQKEENIREVIAFPKNKSAYGVLEDCPLELSAEHLTTEYGIMIDRTTKIHQ